MFPFEVKINEVKPLKQIEDQIKRLSLKSEIRAKQITNKYRDFFQVQMDKIKQENNCYINIENKKQVTEDEKIAKYLEGSWDLQKNKNVALINQKKVYHSHLQKAEQALKIIYYEYDQFIESKNSQIKRLRQNIAQIEPKLKYVQNHYNLLASQYVVSASSDNKQVKLYDVGLIPYLSHTIDNLFEGQIDQVKLGKKEVEGMKSNKNNIIGKVQFLIQLIKKKQQQKKDIDAENDAEIQFYNQQKQILQKQKHQSIQKQKQANSLLQKMKDQQQQHIGFMLKQKRKFDHYPGQISEFKRIITRLNGTVERYRKKEKKRKEDHAKNNTVDKKVERLIQRAKDNQEAKRNQEEKNNREYVFGEKQQNNNAAQFAKEQPFQEEIVEVQIEQKVSQSGRVSSKLQDTVSSVSSGRFPKESDVQSSNLSSQSYKR